MAEYSLYFGTHSAHKANAWILRLWLNHEFAFLKQKDYHHSFFFSSFFHENKVKLTKPRRVGIMNCCVKALSNNHD